MANDDPILIRKRDDVGDGRKRDQTQGADQKVAKMRRRALAVAECLADLPRELERNPRAAKIAGGIRAAGQPRVNDLVGCGQPRPDRVVVGDDQFEAKLASELGLIDRGDSAVDRHDQRRLALLRKPPKSIGIDAVSFLDTMRNVVLKLRGARQT